MKVKKRARGHKTAKATRQNSQKSVQEYSHQWYLCSQCRKRVRSLRAICPNCGQKHSGAQIEALGLELKQRERQGLWLGVIAFPVIMLAVYLLISS